jgi:multiple sugar transport system substrate-binding protein
MTNHPRRQVLAAIVGASAATISGCAVDPNGAKKGSGSGRLRATWWGGDIENKGINAALDRYEETSGIDISRESAPFSGYFDKLATQTAGKNAPDLIMQTGSNIPDYANRKALVDLNDSSTIDIDAIEEGLRPFGEMNDAMYGIAAASNAMGLIINDDLLPNAKAALPQNEYSWEDLADTCRKVQKTLPGDKWAMEDIGGDLVSMVMYIRAKGHEFYDDDGKIIATEDEVAAWYEMWEDMRTDGAVPPADVTSEGATQLPSHPFSKGRAAMTHLWTQDFASISAIVDAKTSMRLSPHNSDNPSLWLNAASLWSISSDSQDPDEVAKVINFLLTDDDAITDIGASLGTQPTQHGKELVRPSLTDTQKTAWEYMDEVKDHSKPLNRLWPVSFTELRTLTAQHNEAVGFGKSSIEEVVDEFFSTAHELEN